MERVPFAPPDVGRELPRIPCGEHGAAVSAVPGGHGARADAELVGGGLDRRGSPARDKNRYLFGY